MTRALITTARIRAILAGTVTEADAALVLRSRRIAYSFSTAGGVLHIRIPARTGIVTVTRTAGRPAGLVIRSAKRGQPARPLCYPFPVPAWTWDD